jgi:hypothetical protein
LRGSLEEDNGEDGGVGDGEDGRVGGEEDGKGERADRRAGKA